MIITLADELNEDKKLALSVTAILYNEGAIYINELEAVELICALIKVFQIPNSNIEVIHFPVGVSKAECLRNAADRIEKRVDTEVSCPTVWDTSSILNQLDKSKALALMSILAVRFKLNSSDFDLEGAGECEDTREWKLNNYWESDA